MPEAAARKYALFISYRHADNLEMGRKWATWLHESVEAYEIPADIVGRTNLRGDPVPATLYPVFRDEEELPADADLSTNIRRALENSGLLVVLCSPRAVKSRFVADEIRYFKELGKSSRILALIIDGEPNASDDPEKLKTLGGEAECFPEPLRFGVPDEKTGAINWTVRTEPIAADCRPGGYPVQGWTTAAAYDDDLERQGTPRTKRAAAVREYAERLELAKLKVIAGAIGMPLGELTRRDKARQLRLAKRRTRILTTLSVVFAGLAIAAAALGWIAENRRKEADAQRREANTQRQHAETRRVEAEDAKQLADREKKQAVATLANSDFLEGVNDLSSSATARTGLAFLARSARAGHEAAAARVWTAFQQQPFWLPAKPEGNPPPAFTKHLVLGDVPVIFRKLDYEGKLYAPAWFATSADGARCVTVLSDFTPGEGGPIAFRVWTKGGVPVTPWTKMEYDGDFYLSGIRAAALSGDGKFLAVIGSPWRTPEYIELWDVDRHRKIGKPISAEGGHPDYQGANFADVWFEKTDDSPVLVTLSSRGNASLFQLDRGETAASAMLLKTHAHDQPVTGAVLGAGLFLSTAVDGSIHVSHPHEEGLLGWPVSTDLPVTGLRVDAKDRFTALLADGKAAAWSLLEPFAVPPPAGAALSDRGLPGLQKDFDADETAKPDPIIADQRGSRRLEIAGKNILRLVADGKLAWERRFPAPLVFARFAGDDKVLAQTEFLSTTVHAVADGTPLRPAVEESALFSDGPPTDTVLASALSSDGAMLLTRSFQWDPPNMGTCAFTVWDAATARPLMRRRVSYDNAASDDPPENHAEFSADGKWLFIGTLDPKRPAAPLAALSLTPPPAVRPLLPGLAEFLSGLRVSASGRVVPAKTPAPSPVDQVKQAAGR